MLVIFFFHRDDGKDATLCLRMEGVLFFLIEFDYYGQTLENTEQSPMFIT